MKKTILAIAVSAALLSSGAYATGNYSRSGVEARVGGAVSSYSGPANGYQSSRASLNSISGAYSRAGSNGFTHGIGWFSSNGVGAHSHTYANGGAFSVSYGTVQGAGASGFNTGFAAYDAEAYNAQNRYGYYQGAETESYSWASGSAGSSVYGTGFSGAFTLSGAYNNSYAHAERNWYGKSEVDGSTSGKSYTLSGALSLGGAYAGAGSGAGQWGNAESWTTDGVYWRSSYANGLANTGSVSLSSAEGIGLAGGYTRSGAHFEALGKDYGSYGQFALVSDGKYSRSNSIRFGNSNVTTFGGADVDAFARAGNVVRP